MKFGTLNTGIFSSSANSINISTAGTQRLELTSSKLQSAVPIQYQAKTTAQIYLSTDTNSGIYRPVLNQVTGTTIQIEYKKLERVRIIIGRVSGGF